METVKLTILDIEGNLLQEKEVEKGKRLVNAIEDAGIDILHLCGSFAKCTTCRIQFVDGEPRRKTAAEQQVVSKRISNGDMQLELPRVRLSCQLVADTDMTFRVLKRLSTSGMTSAGERPADEITPDPVWINFSTGNV